MIKTIRQIHSYLGVFFAPSIIYFAFSGALQTFSLHENHDGKPGIPWITDLAELHKNQRVPKSWPGGGGEGPAPNAATPTLGKPNDPPRNESPGGTVAQAKPGADTAKTTSAASPEARPANPAPPRRRQKSFPLKVFVGFMGIGLILSSLLGIYMAFKYTRGPAVIWGLLIAGTALPAFLLYQ